MMKSKVVLAFPGRIDSHQRDTAGDIRLLSFDRLAAVLAALEAEETGATCERSV